MAEKLQAGDAAHVWRYPEQVDHPRHYNQHPAGVECIEIVEHFDFLVGNVIKYAWRAGSKEGAEKLQDLEKMLWYATRAVARERGGKDARTVHSE